MDIVASRRDARVVVVVVSVSTRQDGRPTSAWLLGGDQSHRDGGGVVSGPCRGASRGWAAARGSEDAAQQQRGVDGISFTVHSLGPWRPFDRPWAVGIGPDRHLTRPFSGSGVCRMAQRRSAVVTAPLEVRSPLLWPSS